MQTFEYKVIPAPQPQRGGMFSKGTGPADQLSEVMNDLGSNGWDFVRTERVMVERKRFLRGSSEVSQNLLVFRRSFGEPATREERARMVLTDSPTEQVKVQPRRVRNDEAIKRVRNGERQISFRRSEKTEAQDTSAVLPMTAAE